MIENSKRSFHQIIHSIYFVYESCKSYKMREINIIFLKGYCDFIKSKANLYIIKDYDISKSIFSQVFFDI